DVYRHIVSKELQANLPEKHQDHWYCGCGQLNLNEIENCKRCGNSLEKELAIADTNYLDERLQDFLVEQDERKLIEENAHKERQRLAAIAKEKQAARSKRIKKVAMVVTPIVAVIAIAIAATFLWVIPTIHFNQGVEALAQVELELAGEKFDLVNEDGRYSEKAQQAYYEQALKFYNAKEYKKAQMIFLEIPNYKESENLILDCSYSHAKDLAAEGKFEQAMALFEELDDYKDSIEQVEACIEGIKNLQYNEAKGLLENGEFEKALEIFKKLCEFKDVQKLIEQCEDGIKDLRYNEAKELMSQEKFKEALAILEELRDFKDSEKLVEECKDKLISKPYSEAKKLIAKGKYKEALVILRDLPDEIDTVSLIRTCINELYNKARYRISTGVTFYVALKSNGKVTSDANGYDSPATLSSWKDIVAVSAGHYCAFGLKADGTVVASIPLEGTDEWGEEYSWNWYDFGQTKVSSWRNIVAISAGRCHTVGLKSDGTVVAVGDNSYGQLNVSKWKDIVEISTGEVFTVGLKSDGTVVVAGLIDYDKTEESKWNDIIAISGGDSHLVGLKSDGTVVAVGNNEGGQLDVSGWKDIVSISAGGYHTVAIKSDGTAIGVGEYDEFSAPTDISDWTDIVAICTRDWFTHGLKADGTVVSAGGYYFD
ncbi:MAG: hypothetical protein GX802_05965, partial [Clostridiales bacterium]|nr:hypothetical protein [Clostridiales bacterium]